MNFERLVARVTHNLGNRSGIEALVKENINSAYLDVITTGRFPETGRFAPIPCPALDGYYTFNTAKSNRSNYPVPSNFLFQISLRDTTNNFTLFWRDLRWMQRHRSTAEGRPHRYTVFGNFFHFDPTPDGPYIMELYYRKKVTVPSLVSPSDTPVIDEIWHEGIELCATYRGARSFREPTADIWLRDLKEYIRAHSEQYTEEEEDFDGGFRPVI